MQMSNHCSQIMMLRSKLKTKLDPMRYEHSLSVYLYESCHALWV